MTRALLLLAVLAAAIRAGAVVEPSTIAAPVAVRVAAVHLRLSCPDIPAGCRASVSTCAPRACFCATVCAALGQTRPARIWRDDPAACGCR